MESGANCYLIGNKTCYVAKFLCYINYIAIFYADDSKKLVTFEQNIYVHLKDLI